MIMCVLLCYPVSIHMSQLLSTGCPISSFKKIQLSCHTYKVTAKLRLDLENHFSTKLILLNIKIFLSTMVLKALKPLSVRVNH